MAVTSCFFFFLMFITSRYNHLSTMLNVTLRVENSSGNVFFPTVQHLSMTLLSSYQQGCLSFLLFVRPSVRSLLHSFIPRTDSFSRQTDNPSRSERGNENASSIFTSEATSLMVHHRCFLFFFYIRYNIFTVYISQKTKSVVVVYIRSNFISVFDET